MEKRRGINSPEDSTEDEINIYLKVKKTISMIAKPSETIKSLKARISEREGFAERLQELFYAGEHLMERQTLADCGIMEGSTLQLFLRNSDSVRLYVNIPSNDKTVVVEVKTQDTVQRIKSVIQEREGIRPEHFTLLHAGKLLDNRKTLASLKIMGESTLYLVFDRQQVLQVFVKTPANGTVKLEAKPLYTVHDVKAIVGNMLGLQIKDQTVFYKGKQLEDSKDLAHYNIEDKSVLDMLPDVVQIFVRKWTGKSITLNVRRSDTATMVLNRIFCKLDLPHQYHSNFLTGSLYLGAKRLEKDRVLGYYNIQKDATLHIGSTLDLGKR